MKVLLVEDHLVSAQAMSLLLKHAGHRVFIAATAQEALEFVHQQSIDLVLSDIGLPDMNGLDLMRRIREEHAMPAISISGFAGEDFGSESRSAGFVAHLTKPVDFAALLATIARVAACPPPDEFGAGGSSQPQHN